MTTLTYPTTQHLAPTNDVRGCGRPGDVGRRGVTP